MTPRRRRVLPPGCPTVVTDRHPSAPQARQNIAADFDYNHERPRWTDWAYTGQERRATSRTTAATGTDWTYTGLEWSSAPVMESDRMELLTTIAACTGALTGLVSAIGVLIVNSKVDRLAGRVDTLEKAVIAKL